MLRKLFGVSWKTRRARCARIRELEMNVESLSRGKSAETSAKLRFESLYRKERQDHNSCARERRILHVENETLRGINRNLAKELHRMRELFSVVFASKAAKEMILQDRSVHLRHLRKVAGDGSKVTVKHVAAAHSIARSDEADTPREDIGERGV